MDWRDPDTWKLPANLIDYWKTILVGGVAIVGAVVTIIGWGLKPFGWVWSGIARTVKPSQISRPLRFVQNEQQSFWGLAKRGDQPGTQVVGHWQVTNTSDRHIWLLRARLHGHPSGYSHVATQGEDGLYSSMHPALAEHMRGVVANFTFFPPIRSGTEPLVVDVIFTDNFEDEHRVRATSRCIQAPP